MAIVSAIFSLMLLFLVIGTIIVIIFDNGDSAKKIAWILVITILPIIGLLLYFAVGFNLRQSSFSKKKHKKFIDTFNSRADRQVHDLLFGHEKDSIIKTEYKPLTRLLSCDGSTCVTDGNGLEIITSGQRKFELLMKDLENAKEYIHMEYFYFRHDDGAQQIKEMLMKKAREGVKVRFIHENIANIDILPGYYNEMKEAGVMVEKFTKPRWPLINLVTQLNYRDHRKIVVIDGKIGYTGGMNISDDYFVKWRDTHIRITGNAVAGLQYSFLDTWITAGGKIDDDFAKYFPMCGPQEPVTTINPAGQNATTENATSDESDAEGDGIAEVLAKTPIQSLNMNFRFKSRDLLVQIVPDEPESRWGHFYMGAVWAVQHARKYIYIQTPYFVPPESMIQALQSAALSGVDVRVMVPKKSDVFFMGPANKSYFKECLEAGVKIYERAGRFSHAKTFVSDDYLSEIGSANMDFRSFNLDYELVAYIYDTTVAKVNKAIFLKDMEACNEVTLEDWERRPWSQKITQRIVRLFAALL